MGSLICKDNSRQSVFTEPRIRFCRRRGRNNFARMTYQDFSQSATGFPPYEYQCRLACGEGAALEKPQTSGRPFDSQLTNVPTGLGRTTAAVLAWLWNRVALQDLPPRSPVIRGKGQGW